MSLDQSLKAMADPVRQEILNLLKDQSLSAGEIGAHFEISAPAVSRHLSILREAGLVRIRKEGSFVIYTLNTSMVEEVIFWLVRLKGESNERTSSAAKTASDPHSL